MRDLRISLDQLRVVDSPSAEKFAAVNRELEIVTMSDFSKCLSNHNVDGGKGIAVWPPYHDGEATETGRSHLAHLQIVILPGYDSTRRLLTARCLHSTFSPMVPPPPLFPRPS